MRLAHLLLPALILTLSACATVPAPPLAAPPTAVSVHVEQLPETGAWRVRYRLPSPTREARFVRPGYGYRQTHWKVISPAGVRIEAADGEDRVSSASGEAFDAFEVELAPFAWKPEKDYQAFIPFSAGGTLVHTGQFNLRPATGPSGAREAPVQAQFTLVPRAAERVVLPGRVAAGPVKWEGSEDGTYAYFGPAIPLESEHLIAVVDSGLPGWIRQRTEALLPQLFAFYAERTGTRLGERATVFLSFTEEPRPRSIGMNGGALEGLIQLEVRLGSAFQREEDPKVEERLLQLTAHEAAHLWHGRMLYHEVNGGDWMHEGGADAFAYRALLHLGLLSREAYLARLSDAASQCALGLEGQALKDVSRPGRYRNHYTCGSTLALIAESELRKAHPGEDVFAHWARLLALAGASRRYDESLYFQALADRGVPPAALARMRRLIDEPLPRADALLLEALQAGGLEVEATEGGPPEFLMQVGGRALRFVLRTDCGEGFRVRPVQGEAMEVDAQCQALGPQPHLSSLAGLSLMANLAAAYDAAAEQCTRQGSVEVGLSGALAPVRVRCEPPVPQRTAYLRLRTAP
ncbi:hypothetical protein F0U60_38705 [Archangium minus]|uniref:Peptidase M61 catalytic domain-containing protein n=1 Tax=Archangium minus TaxID=83450 RepID=A0ABY9X1Y9_9BACT|nr:hypothetical protein F0U60_38705 [Archangium minus]